ncbi:MAG: DUF559 domain-containing protein [Cyclobacteriaceae bacterium]
MYFLPYNKELKTFSRYLRSNSTLSEVLFWQELRAGTIRGYKFNRQKPLGRYIVDFYCKKLKLVIEIDGGNHHHPEAMVRDDIRQKALEELGLSFLRFEELDVKRQMPWVLSSIVDFIDQFERSECINDSSNPPSPL